jgi:hypothetical protein
MQSSKTNEKRDRRQTPGAMQFMNPLVPRLWRASGTDSRKIFLPSDLVEEFPLKFQNSAIGEKIARILQFFGKTLLP